MTITEKREILDDAIARGYSQVKAKTNEELAGKDMDRLLRNIGAMEQKRDALGHRRESRYDPGTGEPPVVVTNDDPPAGTTAGPDTTGYIAPAAEETEEQPTTTNEPVPSKEEVRKHLAALSAKYPKLGIAAIMQELGYTCLSDMPAEKYLELLDKVWAAAQEMD